MLTASPVRRLTLFLCLLVVAFSTYGFAQNKRVRPPATVAVAPVVESKNSENPRQSYVGTVVPARKSVVGSAVDGRVLKFEVNAGDAVKKGDPLAQLRTDTLKIELAAANAELTLRQQELAELQAGARKEELSQAKAAMAGAKSLMEYRKSKHERLQTLFKRGGTVTEDQLQEAFSVSTQATQTYLEAQAQLELVQAGPRIEKKKQAEARVAIQQEQVRLIEDRITKHTIVAPFDGYVTAEHTEVGQWAEKGKPIAEVVELKSVDVQVFVLADHIAFLKLKAKISVYVPALSPTPFAGVIASIVPQADVASRSFPVKIRVKNEIVNGRPVLRAGMLARMDLPTGPKSGLPLIPKDALVLDGGKRSVFVIRSDDPEQSGKRIVRKLMVELGDAEGTLIGVKGALKPGDLVVVRGNERLRDGQAVSVSKGSPAKKPARRK